MYIAIQDTLCKGMESSIFLKNYRKLCYEDTWRVNTPYRYNTVINLRFSPNAGVFIRNPGLSIKPCSHWAIQKSVKNV